jgi:hypothetical protein
MDRIKMVVLSLWSIPNIGKGQAGIARKGVFCGCVWYAIYFNKREGGLFKGTHIFG